jgi:hypothetical protein
MHFLAASGSTSFSETDRLRRTDLVDTVDRIGPEVMESSADGFPLAAAAKADIRNTTRWPRDRMSETVADR